MSVHGSGSTPSTIGFQNPAVSDPSLGVRGATGIVYTACSAITNVAYDTTLRTLTLSGPSQVFGTNITSTPLVLTSSGNQTNYTLPLLPGVPYMPVTLYTDSTNAHIAFTETNANWSRTVLFNGWTNVIATRISFAAGSTVRTNFNFDPVLTNGFSKVMHFYCVDGTNIIVTDGGRWR